MKHALFQMHLAVLLWGFTGVLGKAISLDAPVLVWYRMLLTAAILALVLLFRRERIPVLKKDMRIMILVGCLMGLHWVAFYGAVKFANASIALVCLSTASVFVTLFDPLVNKTRYDFKELLLGLMAIAGVYLIYRFQAFYVQGILWGILAAVLSAVFTVWNKRIAGKYPSRTIVFYEMTAGWGLISLMLLLLIVTGMERFLIAPGAEAASMRLLPGAGDWLWLLVLSLCCTVWAQSLALNALKSLSAFTSTLSVNMEPVYGIILAFIFYRENQELYWGFYAGVGLIFLSVLLQMLLMIRSRRKRAAAGQPETAG